MALKVKLFLALVITLGGVPMRQELAKLRIDHSVHFASLIAVAVVASGLRVTLLGLTETMSVYVLFLLIGLVRISAQVASRPCLQR